MDPTITISLGEYESMLAVCATVRSMLASSRDVLSYSGSYKSVMEFLQDLKTVYDELPADLPYDVLLDTVPAGG